MMGPKLKARITMAILLIVLLAVILTSFGCRRRKSHRLQPDESTAGREALRPHAAIIEEVSLS